MKNLFNLLMLLSVALVAFVSCYDDSEIRERLEALEQYNIASISEQVSNIKSSISALENVDKELKYSVSNLENSNIALEEKISNLKAYADGKLSSMTDWVAASFATLEQYNSMCDALAEIKVSSDSLSTKLTTAIASAELSMKGWVNEQLSEYCTLAEVQARIDALGSPDEDIAALSNELAKTKIELTTAYQKAINDAITNTKGQLSTEIEQVNKQLSNRITAIETRVSVIEEKLNKLMKEFDITFDTDEIVMVKSGGTTTIGYTIKGATQNTVVRALTQNGWKAQVSSYSTSRGRINVESPVPLVEDEIVVIVYDGEYRTIMKTIKCVTAVTSSNQSSVEINSDGGNVDVKVTTNQDYTIYIPETAKDWISVVGTKATRTENITFALKKNEGRMRVARVSLKGKNGYELLSFVFTQKGIESTGIIADITVESAGILLSKLGTNYLDVESLSIKGELNGTDIIVIRRMITDGSLKNLDLENSQIVEGGHSFHSCGNEYFTKNNIIGEYMFAFPEHYYLKSSLEKIILPKNITRIEGSAFWGCSNLKEVKMFEGILYVGNFAFRDTGIIKLEFPDSISDIGEALFDTGANNLISVKLPANLKIIPKYAFSGCKLLSHITLPNAVKEIKANAFFGCGLKNVTIPASVESIEAFAFAGCELSKIELPVNIKRIGSQAFACSTLEYVKLYPISISEAMEQIFPSIVYQTAVLYIPKNSFENYMYTDFGNFKNIVEY